MNRSNVEMELNRGSQAVWRTLYPLAGVSALILLLYSLATLVIVAVTGGQPGSIEATYQMLQANRLIGLLRLDLLTVLLMPLYYVLFLGFCVALWRIDHVGAALSALLVFAGLTLFLASPSAFSYLALSDRYAAAATEAQRAQLLAAGEAIYAADLWHGSGALVGGLLLQAGAVLISVVMLRSSAFGAALAYTGIATHGLDLVHILIGFFAPQLSVALMAVAGVLYLLWFPLAAQRLFRLGAPARAQPSPCLAAER